MDDQRQNQKPDPTQPVFDPANPLQTPPAAPEPQTSVMQQFLAGMWLFAKALFDWVLLPIAIVLVLHYFVFQAYHVDGTSMLPTLKDKDYLIVSKVDASIQRFEHKIYLPKRGQVVVFKYPKNPDLIFVKRAIGLPGDRVVVQNGIVTIYNQANPGGFSPDDTSFQRAANVTLGEIDTLVPDNNIFVLGDNRTPGGSYDSRDWGLLPSADIIGTASLRLLPLDSFKTFAYLP